MLNQCIQFCTSPFVYISSESVSDQNVESIRHSRYGLQVMRMDQCRIPASVEVTMVAIGLITYTQTKKRRRRTCSVWILNVHFNFDLISELICVQTHIFRKKVSADLSNQHRYGLRQICSRTRDKTISLDSQCIY